MTDDWTSASFRSALQAMVRKRVPAGDADDVVQAALTEAVASNNRPADPEGARKWIWGVARNKIADYHRHARRETAGLDADTRSASLPPSSESQQAERELLRWAVGELPDGADAHKTFEWLLREGEGEKLEDIAASEKLPAPQVRQRVSRLRKLFRARWAQLAAAGILVFLVYLAVRTRRREDEMAHQQPPRREAPPRVLEAPEVVATRERARALREEGLRACERSEWRQCLGRLDEARRLDEAGEGDARVLAARARARRELERPRLVDPPDASVPVAVPSFEPSNFGLGLSGTSSLESDPSTGLARRRTNLRALQRGSDGAGGADSTSAPSAAPRAMPSTEPRTAPVAMPSAPTGLPSRPRATSGPSSL